MYIEDLIIALAVSRNTSVNPYDQKIIYSFHDQISRGSGFTEKQENLSIKILKRQVAKLNSIFGKDISSFLENPSFRLTRRTIITTRHMSIQPNTTYGKVIKVEFAFNEGLLNKIRDAKNKLNYSNWDSEQKSWIFSLDERSLAFLINLAAEENFTVDDEFKNYQNQFNEIQKNIEHHIPMLSLVGEKLEFLNISPKIPQPTNSNIVENLFLARKFGILLWGDEIEQSEEWKNSNDVTKKFLQADPKDDFSLNLEENSIFSLADIVKYLSPVLFVIPGGTELEKLELSLDFLKSMEIPNEEISVLFRLPSETGGKFNNFVKEQKLNSPITENTKAVFISSKVPKTIIEKEVKFNSILNFNFYNIHYSIKNLLKWHHNVVCINEEKVQKALNFVLM
jgi:hypothetical protein